MRWRFGRELEAAVAAKRRVQLALVVLILLLGALLATGVYSAFALYQSAGEPLHPPALPAAHPRHATSCCRW